MSGRGDLVTLDWPLEAVRRALAGRYSAISSGGAGIAVRDDLDKLVCRVTVRAVPGDSFWLTLEPLRGYGEDGGQIRARLLDAGFQTEEAWKSARVAISAPERADAAVARVLRRLLEIQDANLPGALADADVEFLHDYRVAIRRARSVLREMRGVFVPDELEPVRTDLKWLQDQTSATRDLDVYLEEFQALRERAPVTMREGLGPIEPLLRERHARARAQMEEALIGDRALALRAHWGELLGRLERGEHTPGPEAARPVSALAGERIRRVHRRMVRTGRAITPGSPPADYHELRKRGKELRYLLELFGEPLFDPAVVRPLVRTLKDLQDVLGRHQDREVQAEMLRDLGQELVNRPGGAAALMSVGTLIDRLEADAAQARGRFTASFAEFASETQGKLVAQAFR
ncbi:MAG TPA: CHAD domain-containing protein [Solirubrobacteraceae bacterium]|nr:CHAD domain-containing protein [Solirubrobacteraceae bacterium]